ncbi:MAG TPA: hypothetical protein VFL13_10445 [Candidatus Baltobacteraceae bacterium]|nr:hypothetical protein [Candidatus Baltobacteraceae bacterium]
MVFALAGCGGGGGGGTASLPGGGNGGGGGGGGGLPSSVAVFYGNIVGADNTFSPEDGDAANGGQGQTVDGIPCLPTMDNAHYHIHAFLGFVVNGTLTALPDGTGMENPGADSSAGVVSTATCFYYLHTHDAAGVIHIEDPSTAARTTALHTLGQYLDIWGHSLSGMTIYTSGARYQGQGDQSVSNTTYSLYTGDPRSIPLYAHEVIWAISGSPSYSAAQLPSVHFSY